MGSRPCGAFEVCSGAAARAGGVTGRDTGAGAAVSLRISGAFSAISVSTGMTCAKSGAGWRLFCQTSAFKRTTAKSPVKTAPRINLLCFAANAAACQGLRRKPNIPVRLALLRLGSDKTKSLSIRARASRNFLHHHLVGETPHIIWLRAARNCYEISRRSGFDSDLAAIARQTH